MSEPTLIPMKTALSHDSITVGHRLRRVSVAGMQANLSSVRELGQIVTPLVIRQRRDKDAEGGFVYDLLDGAHRLTVAIQLDLTTIPVRVFECTNDQAKLLEIDGNLAGAELNPLDTAVFLATRKAIYERLHPETKAGVAGAMAKRVFCKRRPKSPGCRAARLNVWSRQAPNSAPMKPQNCAQRQVTSGAATYVLRE